MKHDLQAENERLRDALTQVHLRASAFDQERKDDYIILLAIDMIARKALTSDEA